MKLKEWSQQIVENVWHSPYSGGCEPIKNARISVYGSETGGHIWLYDDKGKRITNPQFSNKGGGVSFHVNIDRHPVVRIVVRRESFDFSEINKHLDRISI